VPQSSLLVDLNRRVGALVILQPHALAWSAPSRLLLASDGVALTTPPARGRVAIAQNWRSAGLARPSRGGMGLEAEIAAGGRLWGLIAGPADAQTRPTVKGAERQGLPPALDLQYAKAMVPTRPPETARAACSDSSRQSCGLLGQFFC
jgi:hypothetical protein